VKGYLKGLCKVTVLRELGFAKDAVREFSKTYAHTGCEHPFSSCFVTSIPSGDPITLEKEERWLKG
jgi:hypothetical protein